MHLRTLATVSTLGALTQAATVTIAVGQNGLSFSPNSVTANVGDIIEYQFFPPNHSVVMGDFNNPCAPATQGGFFSGFFAGGSENAMAFQVKVNTTDPIFFYCGFPSHCESGMTGVINPSGGQTLNAYISAASGVANTVVPNSAFGGQVVPRGGASSSPPANNPPSPSGGGIYGSGNGATSLAVSGLGVLVAVLLLV